jgi:hypothetical protein
MNVHALRSESAGQSDGPSFEFGVAREVQRGAYYALASVLPLVIVGVLVSRFVGKPDAEPIAYGLIFVGGSLVALRWKMRIDNRGVSRRWFFRWDLWPWERISSGRIEKRHPHTLVDPDRPWWRRRLSLALMAPADITRAMELVNARYRLPGPPEIPNDLDIHYGFRRRVRFDARGICIEARGEARQFLWSEVIRVRITRMDRLRRDFKSLEMTLPDREIEFTHVSTQYGTVPSWRGATPAVVNAFLERYVSADRIDIDVFGEPPPTRIGVQKSLDRTKTAVRSLFL